MTKHYAIVVVFMLLSIACGGSENGGPVTISLTTPIDDPDASGREAFWGVELGGGDGEDLYQLDPPPAPGAMLTLLAAPEDRSRSMTVELVAADGSVAARFDTTPDAVRFVWPVREAVSLRMRADASGPAFDAVIGVRSIEGRPLGWQPKPGTDVAESVDDGGEVPPLVVALPLRK